MNRHFYLLGAVLLGLSFAGRLWMNIFYFRYGFQIAAPAFFASGFYWIMSIVSLSSSLIFLWYYRAKKYWLALLTSCADILAGLVYGVFLYLLTMNREYHSFFLTAAIISVVASIVYAIALIFSSARRNPWLKSAGMSLFLIKLVSIAVLFSSLDTRSMQVHRLAEAINKWDALGESLVLLLFIFPLLQEARKLKSRIVDTTKNISRIIVALIDMAVAITIIFFGINMVAQIRDPNPTAEDLSQISRTWAVTFKECVFVNKNGDTLPYRLQLPLDYDSQKPYPLMVCLHHGGAHGTDNIRQIEAAAPARELSMVDRRRKYPAIVFVPQCPPGFSWGGPRHGPVADSLVFQAIRALMQQYKIDDKRIYVAGASMGGYGSWHFIEIHPEIFAAAIPMCGAGDPALAKNIIGVQVWAFHGAKDELVPVAGSRDMIAAMRSAGSNPRYTEYADKGHNLGEIFFEESGLLDWLFAQKRK